MLYFIDLKLITSYLVTKIDLWIYHHSVMIPLVEFSMLILSSLALHFKQGLLVGSNSFKNWKNLLKAKNEVKALEFVMSHYIY